MTNVHATSVAVMAAFLMLSACGKAPEGPPPVDTAKVAGEVKEAIRKQVGAYAARDAETAASILSADTISMFHGEPNKVGKAAALEAIKAQMSDPGVKLAVSDETVDVAASGDMAVYHAIYRFTYTDPVSRKPATETGNWVAIFKRQADGTMKLSSDMVMDLPGIALKQH